MILACLMDLFMGFVLERDVVWSQIAPMFKHKHAQNTPCDSSSHFRHRDSSEFQNLLCDEAILNIMYFL